MRTPPWPSESVEWVTITLRYEPVRPDPDDDMPAALDDDFHHAVEDAIAPGRRRRRWFGLVESFRGEAGTLQIFCYGPDADRMWAALEPVVGAARGVWYDGSIALSYRDGRQNETRSLSE
ncbi:MAG TPA: hypothetical protein VFX21_01385 [Acidimicrobiia bacterium]|nr:hypothetical protein [Acidimicrobiia bacterium]